MNKFKAENILHAASDEELNIAAKDLVGLKHGPQMVQFVRNNAKAWKTFPGEDAFKLYDTFGLPRDFLEDAVRDRGFTFDPEGFERAMEEQRTKARASWKGGAGKEAANPSYGKLAETFKTELCFYHDTAAKDCHIAAVFTKFGPVNELNAGEAGEVVLDRTVIYA